MKNADGFPKRTVLKQVVVELAVLLEDRIAASGSDCYSSPKEHDLLERVRDWISRSSREPRGAKIWHPPGHPVGGGADQAVTGPGEAPERTRK